MVKEGRRRVVGLEEGGGKCVCVGPLALSGECDTRGVTKWGGGEGRGRSRCLVVCPSGHSPKLTLVHGKKSVISHLALK